MFRLLTRWLIGADAACSKTGHDQGKARPSIQRTLILLQAFFRNLEIRARGKTHLEVIQIKAKDKTQEILSFLKKIFEDKDIEFIAIIFQNASLPEHIETLSIRKRSMAPWMIREDQAGVLEYNKDLEIIKQVWK